jgi:hypothetical protein
MTMLLVRCEGNLPTMWMKSQVAGRNFILFLLFFFDQEDKDMDIVDVVDMVDKDWKSKLWIFTTRIQNRLDNAKNFDSVHLNQMLASFATSKQIAHHRAYFERGICRVVD